MDEWNTKYLKYQEIKILYESSTKILEKTKIIRNKFKTAVQNHQEKKLNKMPAVDFQLGTTLVQI